MSNGRMKAIATAAAIVIAFLTGFMFAPQPDPTDTNSTHVERVGPEVEVQATNCTSGNCTVHVEVLEWNSISAVHVYEARTNQTTLHPEKTEATFKNVSTTLSHSDQPNEIVLSLPVTDRWGSTGYRYFKVDGNGTETYKITHTELYFPDENVTISG